MAFKLKIDPNCPQCKGTGRVHWGFSSSECGECFHRSAGQYKPPVVKPKDNSGKSKDCRD